MLTGHGRVKSKRPEAGEFLVPGVQHTITENVFPGIQLQQLYAFQDLCGFFQAVCGVVLTESKCLVLKHLKTKQLRLLYHCALVHICALKGCTSVFFCVSASLVAMRY